MAQNTGKKIAFCGVLGALATTLLLLGSVIPLALYISPALAMIAVMMAGEEYGAKTGLLLYLGVSLLALLLAADKEIALFFAFVGYYPVARVKINRIKSKALAWALKLLLVNAAVTAMYLFAALLLRLPALTQEMQSLTQALVLVYFLMGNLCLILYDIVLGRFTVLYRIKWRRYLLGKRR